MRLFLSGGIGNQLFQVSAGRELAITLGKPLKIDPSWTSASRHRLNNRLRDYLRTLEFEKFSAERPIPFSFAELKVSETLFSNNWVFCGREGLERHSDNLGDLRTRKNVLALSGSFPSPESHAMLKASNRQVTLSLPYVAELQLPAEYAAVHVRGGDYFALKESFGVLDASYYEEALRLVDSRLPIVWVTDDQSYTLEISRALGIRNPKILSSKSLDPFESLGILARSSAVVAANSTFSWWGAELGSGVAVKVCPSTYSPSGGANWMQARGWISAQAKWVSG